MSDLTLFDVPPAGKVRHRDPTTSVLAARKQRGGAEQTILDVLTVYGPMHADAICARREAWYPPTIVSAISRLVKKGSIRPTGETALSRRGCEQQVYEVV